MNVEQEVAPPVQPPRPMTAADLPARFHDYLTKSVDADGWPLAPGWILSEQGELTVIAMDLEPEQIYLTMLAQAAEKKAAAFVFAVDRFTKPGQGTVRSDLLAGHISTSGPYGVRPFIVEYDPVEGIVDPIDYDNAFWNGVLKSEMLAVMRRGLAR